MKSGCLGRPGGGLKRPVEPGDEQASGPHRLSYFVYLCLLFRENRRKVGGDYIISCGPIAPSGGGCVNCYKDCPHWGKVK